MTGIRYLSISCAITLKIWKPTDTSPCSANSGWIWMNSRNIWISSSPLIPCPERVFGEGVSTFVSPDVFVYKVDGEFLIVLNEDGLPNLHLSPVYDNASENASSKEKEYFNEKIRSAAWLIKSLHQRQRTLYKVVESIVKHQRGFF